MKSLLSVADLSIEELRDIIHDTVRIKKNPEKFENSLKGKILVMIFEKPSTRTIVSFNAAVMQLGGHTININRENMQIGRGETIADSAKVLSRYADGLVIRAEKHGTLIEFAKNSEVPVINALSDLEHPCQIISDLFTVYEVKGRLDGINIVYVGDGNNVCNSLLLGCAMSGINLSVASPKGYEPSGDIVDSAIEISKRTGCEIRLTNRVEEAVQDADILYTDVWVSMGQEKEREERIKAFRNYQVNERLLNLARSDCKVMHCLPAHRGMEITDDILDSENSIVWIQAENKLYAQKAILMKLLG